MKKSAKVLHCFGLYCEMLEFFKFFTHRPSIKEQLLTLRILELGLVEKIAVCAQTNRLFKAYQFSIQ
jgi:hypothetical protein